MKITRTELRKLIMEMPMGGYFGSMHGGSGEDFISAVEIEAMKYPEYSIYIDDASNNPSEFVISSSRRDDVMGPHSAYLTSIHVDVYERDGVIYVDGQQFSSYEQAAKHVLADLEDEMQYSVMNEAMIKPNIPNVPSAEAQGKIDDLARQEEFQSSADSMADVFGYPEGQSYSEDLRTYDQFGRQGASIHVMRELGTKYADSETHGDPEEYHIRRNALQKAAKICDSFDMSMVRPLIDAFTDGANDYEKESMARIGSQPRFEYEAYDVAGRIALYSYKLDFSKGENYSNLFEGAYINETRIKPSIPNVPYDDAYTKIDTLARQKEFRPDADSMAHAFGYPEDRSYSEDLRIYDEAGMPTLETVSVYRHPSNIEIVIPQSLVDDVIDAHRESQTMGWPAVSVFREAAIRVFNHVENETKRIAGNDKNVYEYGLAVRGYRADEYQAAMEAVGEYL